MKIRKSCKHTPLRVVAVLHVLPTKKIVLTTKKNPWGGVVRGPRPIVVGSGGWGRPRPIVVGSEGRGRPRPIADRGGRIEGRGRPRPIVVGSGGGSDFLYHWTGFQHCPYRRKFSTFDGWFHLACTHTYRHYYSTINFEPCDRGATASTHVSKS